MLTKTGRKVQDCGDTEQSTMEESDMSGSESSKGRTR